MIATLRRSVVAAAIGISLMVATAAPVAAFMFKGDGFYARFGPSMDGPGLVVVDRTGGDRPRLTVGIVGLLANEEYFIVARSIGCDGTPSAANRVFRVGAVADADGAAFFTRGLQVGNQYGDVLSVWINQQTPADWSECVGATHFQNPIIFDSDGSLSLTKDFGATWLTLAELRPDRRTRLSIVVGGLAGDDDFRVRLVDRECGRTGDVLAIVTLTDILVSGFPSVVVGPAAEEIFTDKYGSVRVRSLSGNNTWCGNVSLLDRS